MNAIQVIEIENGADVGMIERRSQPGFTLKSFEVGFFNRQFRGEDLDDNCATELRVGRLIDCSLPSGANLFEDPVIP